jgi:putative alpha-1,2-mannosidase
MADMGLAKPSPGAATPFGMIQLSPDTITGGDNGPGYSHHHTTIEGFSFTHMSGIGWYGDLGNFQVMPTIGDRMLDRDKAKSPYSHDQEKASASYYSVDLLRYGIKTELTAAPRAGLIRFTYPEAKDARIQIDLGRRIGQKERWLTHSRQSVRVVDDYTIEGFMRCSSKDGGWGRGDGNVNFNKGGSFTVIATGNSETNIYIQSATLNGKPLNRAWITHDEVAAGGKLKYVMGPEPSKTWGASRENRPPSFR